MRILVSTLAALTVLGAAPAAAQSTRDYFTTHAAQNAAPQQLGQQDREYYRAVFAAIDRQDWAGAEGLLAQRDGPLHPVARAELYLAAGSPRVELPQIEAWLARGRDLPQAEQLARLAVTRGATAMPDLPYSRQFYSTGTSPKRTRPRSVDDGTMPASVREAILARIDADDPDGARVLLDGIDASLSSEARAEWRQRVAWSYYIENLDAQALGLAATVGAGSGPWVAEGDWTMGLAAWRLGDCAQAAEAFERAAFGATNPELRAAAQVWASRAALRCRRPERSGELLRLAAMADDTLYGMIAAEQLGLALPERVGHAELGEEDWRRVGGYDNVRVAVALAEIGRDKLSSDVLLHQARIGDPGDYDALSRLARDLGLPSTQLYMAHNAPSGGAADPASQYPAPKWVPVTGWRVDPALAYAHTLQELNFRAEAVSPAKAQGLMQITPITVREHAPRLGLSAGQVDIFDPGVNLAFGQQNLEMLRDSPATGGALPKIMAAYNAGLTPVTRWNYEVNDQGDPLLWMELIPDWETRSYVAIVMKNYWMYERQAHAASPSRAALAANAWPGFPGTEDSGGRIYLTAQAEFGAELMAIDPEREFKPIAIALLTVSDTRGPEEDTSGDLLAGRIEAAGHRLAARAILRDDADAIATLFEQWIDDPAIDAVVSTGGTGLTGRDVTPEALDRVKDKDIPGFGELFRWVSYQTIGTSTVQSRAHAVVARGTYLFALPGSNGAVKDGWDRILAEQLDSRNRPCNFVELMPRLREK